VSTKATFTKVGIVEESTWGTTPASALQLINVSSVRMTQDRSASRPNVLTGDRRRFPKRVLQKSGGLVIPGPMQYQNTLLLEEGLQNNDIGSPISVSGTTLACVDTDSITDSGNGLGVFAVGDLVYVTGFTTAANNGWKGPLLSVAAGEITFPTGQVSAEVAGDSVTLATTKLLDGSTVKSYSAEWNLTGLTNEFRNSTGLRVAEMSWDWAQGEWATQQVTLAGKVPAMAAATIGNGAATAAKTTGFMNSVDDFQTFKLGAGATTYSATATRWGLRVMNNQDPIYGLSNVGPSNIVVGPQDVELAADFYYDDNARSVADAIEAHTTLWCWWAVVDPQGNRMAFSIPALKPDEGDVDIGEAETIPNLPLTASGHDPAKDSSSVLTTIPYQFGIFYVSAS